MFLDHFIFFLADRTEIASELTDANRKLRCQNAYDYLMASDVSSYSHFVQWRDKCIAESSSLNDFNFKETEAIECALWPNLCPFTAWCDSKISGSSSRLSSKVSFNFKLFSEILDYSLRYDLLHLLLPWTLNVSPPRIGSGSIDIS